MGVFQRRPEIPTYVEDIVVAITKITTTTDPDEITKGFHDASYALEQLTREKYGELIEALRKNVAEDLREYRVQSQGGI